MAQLTASVTATQRRWTVDEIPDARYVKVDDELVEVLARYPRILTIRVLRGAEDSTPATHADGAVLESPAIGSGSNDDPVTEPFVIQSDVVDEAVLHVESTESNHSANLITAQSAGGAVFEVGALGHVAISLRGDATSIPGLLVSPQQMNNDPTHDVLQVRNNFGVVVGGVTKNGYTYIADMPDGAGGPTEGVPDDAELVAGQCIIWFDKTNGAAKLMIKAKQADGTVRTGSVSLT